MQTWWFKNRNLLSHSFEGYKFRKISRWYFFLRHLGFQVTSFLNSLSSVHAYPYCFCTDFCYYKDVSYFCIEPTLLVSFELIYIFKSYMSQQSHILRYWKLNLWHMNYERKCIIKEHEVSWLKIKLSIIVDPYDPKLCILLAPSEAAT